MKNVYLILLLSAAISCNSQSANNTVVDADAFEKGLTIPSIQILDVRTSGEYFNGHIRHALLADWTNKNQFFDRVKYLEKDNPVYIYCLSGSRSAAAAAWLRNNGFKNVIELKGGINAWKNADKPLEGAVIEKQLSWEEYLAGIPKDKITLVDVGAPWCPPCVKMEPVLEELQKDKSLNFQFKKIDAGTQSGLLKYLKIEPIPVFIIYKNGNEVWRKEGMVTIDEFKKQLQAD